MTPIATGRRSSLLSPQARPPFTTGGEIRGATVILQDVTRLRRFDELKNDLVATVAHEFRTPLTSLRMAIIFASKAAGPLTEKQADLLYAAREDCERLQADRRRTAEPGPDPVRPNRDRIAAGGRFVAIEIRAWTANRSSGRDKQLRLRRASRLAAANKSWPIRSG